MTNRPFLVAINVPTEFSRVNSNGANLKVGLGIEELLLYNGGTVCDDNFSNNSAEAICRLLGFSGHFSWSSGSKWEIQSSYEIKLSDIRCSIGDWTACTFRTTQNCDHSEDIFLACTGKKLISS